MALGRVSRVGLADSCGSGYPCVLRNGQCLQAGKSDSDHPSATLVDAVGPNHLSVSRHIDVPANIFFVKLASSLARDKLRS
jgi:hypothetical protein